MHSSEQEKQWKKDAEQLKKDLAKRPKEIKKNEVPIKFGTKKASPKKSIAQNSNPNSSSKKMDDHLRRSLGL